MRQLTLQILSTITPRAVCELPLLLLTGFPPPAALLAAIPAAAAGVAASGAESLSLREAVGFLGTGAGACWLLMQIWSRVVARFTRTPAIEVEFATKAEMKELEERLTRAGESRSQGIKEELREQREAFGRDIRDLYLRINSDAKTLAVDLQSFQRVLGRLEALAKSSGA